MGLAQVLERAPSFAGVESALLERLANAATSRSLSRGDFLWKSGETARALTVIRSGLVKVVRSGARGRAAICGLFGPPQSVGDVAALKGIAYPADAIVATETATLISIPREVMLSSSQQNPQLAMAIAFGMHTQVAALHTKIDVLSAGSVESRLAMLLLRLYDQLGDDFEDGTSTIPVTLSRRELADLVSTSFETAIRVMTRWDREGVVTTEPSGFTVHDMDALRAAAEP
jgi:CRP/FNR family transcriptional regulator, nitrogen oxide reductase regulator